MSLKPSSVSTMNETSSPSSVRLLHRWQSSSNKVTIAQSSSTSHSRFSLLPIGRSKTPPVVSPKTKRQQLNLELKYKHVVSVLGLQVSDLLMLLRDVIPMNLGESINSNDLRRRRYRSPEEQELLDQCRYHVSNILAVQGPYQNGSSKCWPREDLEDIVSILQSFLNEMSSRTGPLEEEQIHRSQRRNSNIRFRGGNQAASDTIENLHEKNLSPCLLVKLHSTIGLLRQVTSGPQCAIESLQKALWIQSKHVSSSSLLFRHLQEQQHQQQHSSLPSCATPEEIGMASHRLALAYQEAGRHVAARSLLQVALEHYEKGAQFGKHHPLVVVAMNELHNSTMMGSQSSSFLRRDQLLETSRQNWSSLPALPILRIEEDVPTNSSSSWDNDKN